VGGGIIGDGLGQGRLGEIVGVEPSQLGAEGVAGLGQHRPIEAARQPGGDGHQVLTAGGLGGSRQFLRPAPAEPRLGGGGQGPFGVAGFHQPKNTDRIRVITDIEPSRSRRGGDRERYREAGRETRLLRQEAARPGRSLTATSTSHPSRYRSVMSCRKDFV